ICSLKPSTQGGPKLSRCQISTTSSRIGLGLAEAVALLQKKVRCCEIVVDTGQYDGEVRRCRISIHVSLDDGITAALKPTHAVGNNAGILTSEEKSLISFGRRVRVDCREVELILPMEKIGDDVRRGWNTIGNCCEHECVVTRSPGESIPPVTAL